MFKNAIPYLVAPGFRLDSAVLGNRIARDCGQQERKSDGFTSPCDHAIDNLIHNISGFQLICWETQERVLPGYAVKDALKARCQDYEFKNGHPPGSGARKELKDLVILELLPNAFVRKRQTFAAMGNGFLIVDTSSQSRADDFMEALKLAIGQFPFFPAKTTIPPAAVMGKWVSDFPPVGITVDRDAVMELPTGETPSIKISRADLSDAGAVDRLGDGYKLKKLGMTYMGSMSFCLDDQFRLSKIRMTETTEGDEQDSAASFDAEITLSTHYIVRLLNDLASRMGGWKSSDD